MPHAKSSATTSQSSRYTLSFSTIDVEYGEQRLTSRGRLPLKIAIFPRGVCWESQLPWQLQNAGKEQGNNCNDCSVQFPLLVGISIFVRKERSLLGRCGRQPQRERASTVGRHDHDSWEEGGGYHRKFTELGRNNQNVRTTTTFLAARVS